MNVTTGYGYFTKDGRITDKYHFPIGEHPDPVGYGWAEVANKEEWDAIEIYVPPVDPEKAFKSETFQEGLFTVLMNGGFSSPNVRSEFAQVVAFATGTKQFAQMKQYLQWLISISFITEADYTAVNEVLKLQNIDLENYT